MNTIALRFNDNIAPKEGTIKAHEEVIKKNGYVWYGKFGQRISKKNMEYIMESKDPKILLINSRAKTAVWAHVEAIAIDMEDPDRIPSYYRDKIKDCGVWFKITGFDIAEKEILNKCITTSNRKLSEALHCMSPFFSIHLDEEA